MAFFKHLSYKAASDIVTQMYVQMHHMTKWGVNYVPTQTETHLSINRKLTKKLLRHARPFDWISC